MATGTFDNRYAQLLKEQGDYVITVKGVDWYHYNRFMMPAYLPHCTPSISNEIAEEVLRISNRLLVRWNTPLGSAENSEWWYILKRGPWAIDQVKDKKKRWMIRQGQKNNFTVRPLTFDEVITKCPGVAQAAKARYKGKAEIETQEIFEKRAAAATKIKGVLEYIGCFCQDKLVSFSENYIQNNAVWLANIRHDPLFLSKFSSYSLIDGILNYYLNDLKMDYVLDGSRSIHHRTEFQDHLIKVFGFTKEYALLNVVYSAYFEKALKIAYPLRKTVWFLCGKCTNSFLDNIGAVLKQEYIRRSCADIKQIDE